MIVKMVVEEKWIRYDVMFFNGREWDWEDKSRETTTEGT